MLPYELKMACAVRVLRHFFGALVVYVHTYERLNLGSPLTKIWTRHSTKPSETMTTRNGAHYMTKKTPLPNVESCFTLTRLLKTTTILVLNVLFAHSMSISFRVLKRRDPISCIKVEFPLMFLETKGLGRLTLTP
jgi:hypothetical protein